MTTVITGNCGVSLAPQTLTGESPPPPISMRWARCRPRSTPRPLEEAVRRKTGLPAARFGLTNRGQVRPGAYTDITVFDPASVIDRASFAALKTPAAGIELVLVNGQFVWQGGAPSGVRRGGALRRQAMQAEQRP